MGLKTVHLVFVACALLMSAGLSLWAAVRYRVDGQAGTLALAGCSILATLLLAAYAPWFLRKLKGVGYL